jgi:excinuclease UvrABC ATPase subunit
VVADHVDVDIPLGVLTVVTGVAGSGKSSLIHGSLPRHNGVSVVNQSAIRRSRRSNPATYTGPLDPIRTAFATPADLVAPGDSLTARNLRTYLQVAGA